MSRLAHVGHLARRFGRSLSKKPPSAADEAWATSFLTEREAVLWGVMSNADRRHAIEVAHRFVGMRPESPRDDIAAALLHDVGKVRSDLGTFSRVLATIVGPRTTRFRLYHDHEQLGAEMLRRADSSDETVALVAGASTRAEVAAALRAADDI